MKRTWFTKGTAMLLSVALLVLMLPAFSSAAAAPTISLSSAGGAAGSTVDVAVNVANNPGIASATLTITYPSDLTLLQVADAGKLGAVNHKNVLANPYVLCWANDTATTNYTVNGTVATLSFALPATAAVGTQYPITLSYDYDSYDIMNVDSQRVNFSLSGTFITVKQPAPAAPAAPIPTIRMATSLKVKTVAGYEYRLNDGAWQASPTFTGLTPNTTYRVYQRVAATATTAASESSPAVQMTTRLRGPAAPDAPTPTIRMATSLKLKTVAGYQYRLEGGEWQNSAKFTGLKPGTTYKVYQRIAQTDTHNPSDASEPLYITTRQRGPAAPAAPIATIRLATSLKVKTVAGYEYRLNDGAWQTSPTFKGLKPGTTYKIYQRVAQTDTHNPSDASVALTITTRLRGPAAPAAPVATIRTTTSIKVKTMTGYQYKLNDGAWQDSPTFTGLKSGTTYKIYQRVAQTDTHNPSDASEALIVKTK